MQEVGGETASKRINSYIHNPFAIAMKSVLMRVLRVMMAAEGILAGHGMFEPKVGVAPSRIFSTSEQLAFASTANATHHLVHRSLAIKKGRSYEPWPDKTIRYCFADAEAKGKLYEPIKGAMDIWHTAGLPSNFKMEEVSDTDCRKNRDNVLLVSYDLPRAKGGKSKMTTSPGKTFKPSMMLTDDETIGMLSFASNVVHELGHAWGLFHEQQNPNFWPESYGGTGGTTFSLINWVCENLMDYEDALAKIQKTIDEDPSGLGDVVYGGDKKKICTNRDVARRWGFSAVEYLPLLKTTEDFTPGTTDDDDVDWDSIMLYPSGAGGKADGSGKRKPVLKKPNGDDIDINTEPSQRDVKALITLYGASTKFNEELLNEDELFKKIRSKDIGLDC